MAVMLPIIIKYVPRKGTKAERALQERGEMLEAVVEAERNRNV